MRKNKDIEIFHCRGQAENILRNQTKMNIKALTAHDTKMLFNFKSLFIVG